MKLQLVLYLLAFCIALPYGNILLVEAAPPYSGPAIGGKGAGLEQGKPSLSEQAPDNAKNDALESIKESWLAEIQSSSLKEDPSAKRKASLSQDSSGAVKGGSEQFLSKREKGQEPVHVDKKLYLPNPHSTVPKQGEGSLQKEEGAPSFSSAALRFILFIFLLVLLIYFGLRFFRSRNQGFFRRGDDLVQLLVSVPLVQGKFLQIVDVAGQLLVLGVSEAGVQLLTNISEGISADRIRLWQSRQSPEASPNKNIMDKLIAVIKGSDLRFWNAQGKQNFSSILKQFTGQLEKKGESNESSELKRLLMSQKRELSKKNK